MSYILKKELHDVSFWLKFGIGTVMISGLLAIAMMAFTVIEQIVMPRAYWFTYYSVEPTKYTFRVGEPIIFESSRKIREAAQYEWHDTLRCDLGNGYKTMSIFHSGKILEPHKLEGGNWDYNGNVPVVAATCFLISTTTAKLKYANKSQTLVSLKFKIK